MTDTDAFHRSPILNSPYAVPARHWVLDESRQPTQEIAESRRKVSFITPIPKPRKTGRKKQGVIGFDEKSQALSDASQQYELGALIDALRQEVAEWRALPERQWRVTPETARLLKHWRHHEFSDIRPFFCQVEAVETAIWLTEVAPHVGNRGRRFLDRIKEANEEANPGLPRLALKLATGAGKTAVMAMLIAWQTVNAARRPNSPRFTRGFLVVAPGITVRDRLRVLQPNDPDSYYKSRELVPADMLPDLNRAVIVVTNYHAFLRHETVDAASGTRRLMRGRRGKFDTAETDGQVVARACRDLMRFKGVMVLNDEAHHCYQAKPPGEGDEAKLTGDDRKDAEKDREAARVWISGLKAVQSKLGIKRVVDLSATPFFLRGSGYAEGTLFPWTVSDFSLMDAIECGIVKLPRVPVIDDHLDEMPMFRNLWEHIGRKMPKSRSGASGDPAAKLPRQMKIALDALYSHYEKTFERWHGANAPAPPCFIVVCNSIATSKLVYEYIAGYHRGDGEHRTFHSGALELFHNFDAAGVPLATPRTLLIDSRQLESGDALDKNFRDAAADEIERFRRERVQRGDHGKIAEKELLREVLNTVGKPGQLGGGIRCVVSVAMLTEGWDANTVTHIFGLRAFGTQLLCEQVVGRSLRRQSYKLNDGGLFDAEYADVFGIPFDFTAKPVITDPPEPSPVVQVRALSPERDGAEIRFPRVVGYRRALADERIEAEFTEDSKLTLTAERIPTKTTNQGIIGEGHDLTAAHLDSLRPNAVIYELAIRLVLNDYWRDGHGEPRLHLFGQLKRIAGEWVAKHLECERGTCVGHLLFTELADEACERIIGAITRSQLEHRQPVKALVAACDEIGSTRDVSFNTSQTQRYRTGSRCHLNWAILDSAWEGEMCRVLDSHPQVLAWVKNHRLGFVVPYRLEGGTHRYVPDFIVLVDDGRGAEDPLHLVVEVKGYRGEDAKAKKAAMETCWVPGINALGTYGRWDFLELRSADTMERRFDEHVRARTRAS